jgi:hypothetical protein
MQVRKSKSKHALAKAKTFLRQHSLEDLEHILSTWEDDCHKGPRNGFDPLKHFTSMTVLQPGSYAKRLERAPSSSPAQVNKPAPLTAAELRSKFPHMSEDDILEAVGHG